MYLNARINGLIYKYLKDKRKNVNISNEIYLDILYICLIK
jgi:hypothetical protein